MLVFLLIIYFLFYEIGFSYQIFSKPYLNISTHMSALAASRTITLLADVTMLYNDITFVRKGYFDIKY